MTDESNSRPAIGKEARLWGLAVVCAAAGAITVYLKNSFLPGLMVFVACLVVLGGGLYAYEKRHKK